MAIINKESFVKENVMMIIFYKDKSVKNNVILTKFIKKKFAKTVVMQDILLMDRSVFLVKFNIVKIVPLIIKFVQFISYLVQMILCDPI